MKSTLKGMTFLMLVIVGSWSCEHEVAKVNPLYAVVTDTTTTNPPVVPPITPVDPITVVNACSADTVYFASQLFPLILSSCAMAKCHDNITKAEGVVLTDYANIMRYVSAGSPTNSKLYRSLIDNDPGNRMPRLPVAPFTQTQIDLVAKWIRQGAKNKSCNTSSVTNCDTLKMSFVTNVSPILKSSCTGCHNATSPSGNINLTTYAGTKVIASRLSGSLNHLAGYIAMPSSTIKLSACDINKITAWVHQGALNN